MDSYLIVSRSEAQDASTILFVANDNEVAVYSDSPRAAAAYKDYVARRRVARRNIRWLSTRFPFCDVELGTVNERNSDRINSLIEQLTSAAESSDVPESALPQSVPWQASSRKAGKDGQK